MWRQKNRRRLPASVALLIGLLLCGTGSAEPPRRWVLPDAGAVFQGGILKLRVPARDLTGVEGIFSGEKIHFHFDGSANFTALLGIDLEAKPGPAKLQLQAVTRAGAERAGQIALRIQSKRFPQESFTVPPQFDELSPDVLERIRIEREQFARAFTGSAAARLWERAFVLPVTADISAPFGYRRIINGAPRAPHSGVDLKAPTATPVLAANNGRVALLGDFFYSGKSVVLDHGGGLYTMYFHLSEIRVEHDGAVRQGDLIALSGMSGRVTGPHLHWAARLNGARVDPLELVEKSSDGRSKMAPAEHARELQDGR